MFSTQLLHHEREALEKIALQFEHLNMCNNGCVNGIFMIYIVGKQASKEYNAIRYNFGSTTVYIRNHLYVILYICKGWNTNSIIYLLPLYIFTIILLKKPNTSALKCINANLLEHLHLHCRIYIEKKFIKGKITITPLLWNTIFLKNEKDIEKCYKMSLLIMIYEFNNTLCVWDNTVFIKFC